MLDIVPGENSAGAGHGDEHHQRQTRAETEIEVYELQSRSLGISLFLTPYSIGMVARRQCSRRPEAWEWRRNIGEGEMETGNW